MAEVLTDGRHEHIALLNNDTEVHRDWLTHLAVAANAGSAGENQDEAGRIGMVASLMTFFDRPDRVENAGAILLASGDAIPIGRGSPTTKYTRTKPCALFCGGAVLLRATMLREDWPVSRRLLRQLRRHGFVAPRGRRRVAMPV